MDCGKGNITGDIWATLKKIPAMRYLKEPAGSVSELYARYPDGVERGSFALVLDENCFYRYNQETGTWEDVGTVDRTPTPAAACCAVKEAPIDGKLYARKDGAWAEITETEETETGIADLADFDDYFNNDFLIEF
jgi:hypothetical protein